MKTQNAFWTTVLVLAALTIGGCSLEVTQEDEPGERQANQQPQDQEAEK
jgi:hypothetical protein